MSEDTLNSEGFLLFPTQDWENIKPGVLPRIMTSQEYRAQGEENLWRVQQLLNDRKDPFVTDPKDLLLYHRVMFEGIAVRPGTFAETQRSFGGFDLGASTDLVQAACDPWAPMFLRQVEGLYLGVHPKFVKSELILLKAQLDELLKHANSPSALIRLAAFYHARLVGIHAFPYGNGGLARLLLENAVVRLTKRRVRTRVDYRTYATCLNHSHEFDNIGPIADLMAQVFGLTRCPKYLPSPYQIPPLNLNLPLKKALERSQRGEPAMIGLRAPPLRRKWFEEDWRRVEELRRRVDPHAKRPLMRQSPWPESPLTVSSAIILILEKYQEPRQQSAIRQPIEDVPEKYFAIELFKGVLLAMSREDAQRVIAGLDSYFRGSPMRASDFNTLFRNAVSAPQPAISEFARGDPATRSRNTGLKRSP